MKKHEMEAFRPQLLKLEEQLWDDVGTLGDEVFHRTDVVPGNNLASIPGDDPSELGSENVCQQATIGLLERESARLFEINAALERIDEGSFGNCEDCGKQITRTRLQAIPFARQCFRCARGAQQGEAAEPGNL
jgi:DnaK suppressor protein